MAQYINGEPGFAGGPELKNVDGSSLDPNNLEAGKDYSVFLGFENVSFAYEIPTQDVQIAVDFGAFLSVDSSKLSSSPLSDYFDFTINKNSGNDAVVAVQKKTIAPGFFGTFQFPVKSLKAGKSSIIGNIFLINQNPDGVFISDAVDQDNTTSSIYSVSSSVTPPPPPQPTPTPTPVPNPDKDKAVSSLQLLSSQKLVTATEQKAIQKRIDKKYKK